MCSAINAQTLCAVTSDAPKYRQASNTNATARSPLALMVDGSSALMFDLEATMDDAHLVGGEVETGFDQEQDRLVGVAESRRLVSHHRSGCCAARSRWHQPVDRAVRGCGCSA